MKRAIVFAMASVAMAASGCATAPIDHDVQKTHVYTDSKDVIWERAVSFFAENNLSIKTIEKASGIIAADRAVHGAFSPDMSANADCGASPLMTTVGGTEDLNLFVRPLPDGKTSVTVNRHFTITRMLGRNYATQQTFSCTSTGTLETAILSKLGNEIGS